MGIHGRAARFSGLPGLAAVCAALAVWPCLGACARRHSPPALPAVDDRAAALLLVTVERIEYSPLVDSDINWAVYTKVDRTISGRYGAAAFSFRVRNPTLEGLEIGRRYRIKAVPFGRGYRIERLERVKEAPR
jgi:hypothetical protein